MENIIIENRHLHGQTYRHADTGTAQRYLERQRQKMKEKESNEATNKRSSAKTHHKRRQTISLPLSPECADEKGSKASVVPRRQVQILDLIKSSTLVC